MLGNHLVRARVGRGHRRHRTALGVILAVVVVVIASCTHAGNDNQKDTTSGQFAHPSGADQVVIQVSERGRARAARRARRRLAAPRVDLGGWPLPPAGRPGADTPALVALEERRIPEAALQNLLAKANNAGLLADSPDFGTPEYLDAVNTRILVVTDGRRHDVLVRALGYPVADLDAATVAARERVRASSTCSSTRRASPVSALRARTHRRGWRWVLGPAAASTAMPPATWPLGDLATVGTPTNSGPVRRPGASS